MIRLGGSQADMYLNIQNKVKNHMKKMPNLKNHHLVKFTQLSRLLIGMGSTLSRQLTTKQRVNQAMNLKLQAMVTPSCKSFLHVLES